ncbi:hypothetical protein [Alkalihalobacillus sp. R86527]|uniref:hypothetical protein n=1 Tax=Alkalihalobacillus sp. R86527 TaxID=3093863 RepID=UPI00366DE9C9
MEIISLSSLLGVSGEEETLCNYLSRFSTCQNKDVESFLHNKAIYNEKRAFTRTSLIVHPSNKDIVGYFTLLIKPFHFSTDVSKSTRRKLTGDKNASTFNTILIGQLGRNDQYKGIVKGKEILQFALENCERIYDLSALQIVCVEYQENKELIEFYQSNEFTIIQQNESGLILSYIRF